jgi:hypothetical protein
MEKIVFEGTREQIENLKALLEYGDNNLPREVVVTERDKAIERLGHYVSEDDTHEAYDKLVEQEIIDGDVMADDIVMMWEPLEFKYTVSQLLDEIS